LALCALSAVPGWAADPASADVGAKARSVLADRRYQRELPLARGGARSGLPGEESGSRSSGGGSLPDRSGGIGGRPRAPGVPEEGEGRGSVAALPAPGAEGLGLLVLAVLAVVALALFLLRVLQARQERERLAAPVSGRELSRGEPGERPLGDADRLAAQGRYAEAVHVLLLQTTGQLAERFRVPLQPSRTSREILRVLPLKTELREPLADLVRMVERSLFGGAAVGPADYQRGLGLVRFLLGSGGRA